MRRKKNRNKSKLENEKLVAEIESIESQKKARKFDLILKMLNIFVILFVAYNTLNSNFFNISNKEISIKKERIEMDISSFQKRKKKLSLEIRSKSDSLSFMSSIVDQMSYELISTKNSLNKKAAEITNLRNDLIALNDKGDCAEILKTTKSTIKKISEIPKTSNKRQKVIHLSLCKFPADVYIQDLPIESCTKTKKYKVGVFTQDLNISPPCMLPFFFGKKGPQYLAGDTVEYYTANETHISIALVHRICDKIGKM